MMENSSKHPSVQWFVYQAPHEKLEIMDFWFQSPNQPPFEETPPPPLSPSFAWFERHAVLVLNYSQQWALKKWTNIWQNGFVGLCGYVNIPLASRFEENLWAQSLVICALYVCRLGIYKTQSAQFITQVQPTEAGGKPAEGSTNQS